MIIILKIINNNKYTNGNNVLV